MLPILRAISASSALRLPSRFMSPDGLALCLLLGTAFSNPSLAAASCFLLASSVKPVIRLLHGDENGGAFLFAAVCECEEVVCCDDVWV